MNVKNWCRENGVSEKTYYHWRRRILKSAQEDRAPEFAELHVSGFHAPAVASLKMVSASHSANSAENGYETGCSTAAAVECSSK